MKQRTHNKKTIAQSVSYTGIGLHSGQHVTMTLKPITTNAGIIFQRTDMPAGVSSSILSTFGNVVEVDHSTNLGDHSRECVIRTVEHLLAVLHVYEIDNVLVQLDGPEVPITDGSSKPLVDLIERAGIRELPYHQERMIIRKAIEYSEGDKYIRISPFNRLKVTYHIDFPNNLIGQQTYSVVLNKSNFIKKIAPARTFCLLKEVEYLKQNGLAQGGSLENAVVVAENRVLNGGLRFDDEFVRHKVLDVIGDLYLLGKPVSGHVEVNKGGHHLHTKLLQAILTQPDCYTIDQDPVSVTIQSLPDRNRLRSYKDRVDLYPVSNMAL
ncbi:UDP-3-O-[3-hydroxymyristoyl] N-acetylglucosamine deacetylase [bacterium]|nr:UDP-3-O-[3-hydroxymyristoyl] N-acetylglucosamine deacetylase [bacterium]